MKNLLCSLLLTTVLAVPAVAVAAERDVNRSMMNYESMDANRAMTHRDWRNLDRSEIQAVQQTLADAGFYRSGIDGKWGPKTTEAMRNYQRANGLNVTGTLDEATMDDMSLQVSASNQLVRGEKSTITWNGNASNVPYEGRVGQSQMMNDRFDLDGDGVVNMATSSLGTNLSPKEVQAVQQTLADAYFYKGNVDGTWDVETSRALASFQISNGLAGTGKLDVLTEKELGLQLSAANQIEPLVQEPKMGEAGTYRSQAYIEPAAGNYYRNYPAGR